jgi:hypothetical protein
MLPTIAQSEKLVCATTSSSSHSSIYEGIVAHQLRRQLYSLLLKSRGSTVFLFLLQRQGQACRNRGQICRNKTVIA